MVIIFNGKKVFSRLLINTMSMIEIIKDYAFNLFTVHGR